MSAIVLFILFLWLTVDDKNMSYIEPNEWDETIDELEPYEEDEETILLRSEKDRVLSSMNHGVSYQPIELNNII